MKKVIAGALLICVLTVLVGCTDWNDNSDGIKIIEQVKDWTETLGKKQITKDSDLCGERIWEQEGDYYSGSYNAQAEQMAGREVRFGGAGVEERTVICNGNIETKSGSAEIRGIGCQRGGAFYQLPLRQDPRCQICGKGKRTHEAYCPRGCEAVRQSSGNGSQHAPRL